MKSILFIGGAGFIGFHLTRYFSEKYPDYRLIHLDKLLTPGAMDNVQTCRKLPQYFFEHGDACIAQRVVKLFQEFDVRGIILLAATEHSEAAVKTPRPLIDCNLLTVFTVLEAARTHWQSSPGIYKLGYNDCRIHFVSTAEVYGNTPFDTVLTENAPICPQTPYAATKVSAEMLLSSYVRTYDMHISMSRPSVVYGPSQSSDKFIPQMISRALSGKNLTLTENGQVRRDWLYIDDAIRALDILYHRAETGSIYNIALGSRFSDLDVLRAVCAVLDIKKPRLNGQKYERLIRLTGNANELTGLGSVDTTHIKTDMDWQATELFETGLVKTVASYLK